MQFSETQKTVFAMLTENTGTHFLDSGGTNGRMWQRNQGKSIQDFANEPEQSVNISNWVAANGNEYTEIERTVSVFHYLSQLELDDLCEHFNDIQDECNNWEADCEAYGVSREAWQMLIDECDPDIKIDRVWNTYNGKSDLSQVLQGAWLEVFGEPYVLIQVHGGADVRGGYTNAKLFKMGNECMIHEYLMEYVDSYEMSEELRFIKNITYNGEPATEAQIEEAINSINV